MANVDKKLETEFCIAICRSTDDKWQSKTRFLTKFDPHLSIVKSVYDCRLSGVLMNFDDGLHFEPVVGTLYVLQVHAYKAKTSMSEFAGSSQPPPFEVGKKLRRDI